MTVYVNDYKIAELKAPALSLFIEGTEDVAAFKQLIHNGANLYPNLSAAMRELVDLVISGKVLQDYRSQK